MEALLNQPVLVLNRLWQAVSVCTVKRAFSLLYMGQAQVVDATNGQFQTLDFTAWHDFSKYQEEGNFLRSVNFRIRVPQIIVLMVFDRLPKKEVKLTRNNIYERDHHTCQYCGVHFDRKDLNIDHVVPRDKGGKTTWENVVCSCIPCNSRKGNHLTHEIGMKPMTKPKRPKLRTFLNIQISNVPHDSWKHFLDVAYWNVELSD
ncbi:MAG: HNH endonuclease [Blastochloris sp.]|jgi:5-methylcytosine-specific restriction endonuclease McrA|nr:HNH endonuclease [Blastochloris sp.]